jgi:ABC-type lipoprotein export system ATPase subunit
VYKRQEEHQQTILVVTHDINFASRTQRVIEIVDGEIVSSVNN